MQALILAGGEGTRLRPLTLNTPKPIVPIGNEPFLLRQIQLLRQAGVSDIILSTGYQPKAIKRALGNGSRYGVRLKYLVEPAPLGTAGAYKFAERYLKSSTFVLNGDILTDIDLKKVSALHKQYNSTATIVLKAVDNPLAYGIVEVGKEDKVLRFLEKPAAPDLQKIGVNTINAGIYILEPKVLDYIPKNKNYSFEYEVFPTLLHKKENFRAFVAVDDYWIDIGTHTRYLQAHQDVINRKMKGFEIADDRSQSEIALTAEISDNSLIGNGCFIGNGAKITSSVLGENVSVNENAFVENSVVGANTRIGKKAKISGVTVGQNCSIGNFSQIRSETVLGDHSVLTDYSKV